MQRRSLLKNAGQSRTELLRRCDHILSSEQCEATQLLPNLKVLWVFQCVLVLCLRFWVGFVCELVPSASLPSSAGSAVCRTRVQHKALSWGRWRTCVWKVPFTRLWARSLLRRAGKRKTPVCSHIFLVLCDVNCCAKGDLAKTSWAVHRARVFITQVPFFLPFSLSLFFWKDWVCLLVLSVHCSCRMNLGWFLFFTLYTQQTA